MPVHFGRQRAQARSSAVTRTQFPSIKPPANKQLQVCVGIGAGVCSFLP